MIRFRISNGNIVTKMTMISPDLLDVFIASLLPDVRKDVCKGFAMLWRCYRYDGEYTSTGAIEATILYRVRLSRKLHIPTPWMRQS